MFCSNSGHARTSPFCTCGECARLFEEEEEEVKFALTEKFMCSNISFLPLFFTQVSKWSADDMKGSFILSRKKTDLFNPFYFFSLLLAENVIDINMSVGPSLGSAILASITVQVESMAFFPRFF